nr:NAD(P)-dependent oxidoreductase [uncultured Methanoregula sp.]
MKAFVSGGAGFVGRYLIKELLKKGITPVVYDRIDIDTQKKLFPKSCDIQFIQGDILNQSLLKKSMEGCDFVFHTAAIAEIDIARGNPVKTMEINVLGTVHCLEAARQNGVKRFLYASSVYASGNKGSFYRVSKQAGEALCKTYFEDFGLEFTILRYGSLYGRDPNHWNFMYNVCKELLLTGEFTYPSSPDALREYIHINDAARETIKIALEPDFINKSVLITGHQRLKMKEFFDMIEEILGRKITIHYAESDNHRHYVKTPYAFEVEVPTRINLSTYVDISEGILDCLKEIRNDMESQKYSEIEHDNP